MYSLFYHLAIQAYKCYTHWGTFNSNTLDYHMPFSPFLAHSSSSVARKLNEVKFDICEQRLGCALMCPVQTLNTFKSCIQATDSARINA